MKISELVKHIVDKECGKSNVKIGDVREIVGIISDHVYVDFNGSNETILALWANGKRRAKKKK